MKILLSRIKMIGFMLFVDIVVSGMFFMLLLDWLSTSEKSIRIIGIILAISFFILVIVVKYLFIYRQLGRDDVTGGYNRRQPTTPSGCSTTC